jgi:LmbE family N-acetylglucosaminyl deacetylase
VNVTALLAHPDDELMCAGTLARFVAEGHTVNLGICFFSDFGPDHQIQGRRDERLGELVACAQALGVTGLRFFDFPEPEFVWSQPQMQMIEKGFESAGPTDLLISHRVADANTSHSHLGRVARTLARKNRMSLWEVDAAMPGGIEPDASPPNHFVDISGYWSEKRLAVESYRSQLDRYPGLEAAIEHRDLLYGWMIGTEQAEGFRIVRSVQA